jgi:hypothetical protein
MHFLAFDGQLIPQFGEFVKVVGGKFGFLQSLATEIRRIDV